MFFCPHEGLLYGREACLTADVHGRGPVFQGTYVAGGYALQGSVCGQGILVMGRAWLLVLLASGRYASYWKVDLFV